MRLVDQRALPARLRYLVCTDVDGLIDAISSLAVRGAPAPGAATAVNLAGGVARGLDAYERGGRGEALAVAQALAADDIARNRRIGANGAGLVPVGGAVLTHCNTGSLACVGYGTALGVVRAAFDAGRRPTVWVDETRPLLQGARLTMWGCMR